MRQKLLILIYITLTLTAVNAMESEIQETAKIHLVTMGPGDDIFLRWGHFGILVDYPPNSKKRDLFYDYGTFSFAQSDFYTNFINGIMTYSKEHYYANMVFHIYKATNRTIVLQELNLTPKQIQNYIDKLNWEIQPENKYYQYDQYKNNCVSEMVKFLNTITEGKFLEGTDKKTGRSLRDYSRDYVSSNYFYNLLIMFILGSKVEYNTTIEESLFLPDYTMDWADTVYIDDETGKKIPLVKNKVVLNKSVDRAPVILNAKPKYLLNTIIGSILGILILILSRFRKFYKISLTIIGITFGIMGIIFFFMGFFTEHYYIHNNWNLIFMNPLTLFMGIGGLISLIKRLETRGLKIVQNYIDITLGATVAMIILKSIGLIYQENGEIICLFLPILLLNSSFKYLIPTIKKEE